MSRKSRNPKKSSSDKIIRKETKVDRLRRKERDLRQQERDLNAAIAMAETREYYKKDFYAFCTDVCGFKDFYEPLHGELCKTVSDEEEDRVLVIIPRGHFKSTIISICYPLWLLINDPNRRIALISVGEDKAEENLQEVIYRAKMEKFQTLYGDTIGHPDNWPKRSKSMIRVNRKGSTTGPSIAAYGTGSAEVGRHFDHILIDDMIGEREVKNPLLMEKAWSWFGRQFAVLDPGTKICVIGTKWGTEDVYDKIRSNKRWTVVWKQVETGGVWKGDTIRGGNYIFPTRFNDQHLSEIRENMREDYFFCFYYNQAIVPGRNCFDVKKLFWIEYDPEELNTITYLFVDPATTTNETSSYSGMVLCDGTSADRIVVREIFKSRYQPDELIDRLIELIIQYEIDELVMEAEGAYETLVVWLREKLFNKEIVCRVTSDTTPRNKRVAERLETIQPHVHGGKIVFDSAMNDLGREAMTEEMMFFPKTPKRDILSAMYFMPKHVKFPYTLKKDEKDETPREARFMKRRLENYYAELRYAERRRARRRQLRHRSRFSRKRRAL